ncbi:equilibrative nucleoside transporter 1-like isoform X2 [Panulirus ornatus]|uniref:equilibrative nucleoside transporter 1-like isoform X2 n=1 Tax=Panulirus ornatus TaxID=150431 RepID=UPI003A88D04E
MEDHIQEKTPLGVVLVFYAIGMATLLPWNFFITAETYWQYKLRNTSLGEEYWGDLDPPLTPLQITFTPTQVIVANVVCTVFLIVNTAIVRRVSEGVRHLGSLALSLFVMCLVTIFTFLNSDSWQLTFFIITMIIVAIMNVCMAVFQGSSYGLAGLFPSLCMRSMASGQAIAGVFTSLARILSLLVGEEPVTSGLVFFSIADGFLLLTMAGYIYLTRTGYYARVKSGLNPETRSYCVSYSIVLKKVWLMGLTFAGTLFVTLMVYPAVLVYITSVFPESQWTEVYFQPTITFLLFNVGDWLGREAPRLVKWPGPHGPLLHVMGSARLVFVPLLMLCHGKDKTFPTVFDHDAFYIVLLFLFAFTNGYISTLTVIYYPSLLESGELEVGGAIMAAMLGVGMVSGSLLSVALVALWGPV